MSTIKIYRSTLRHGSVIEATLIREVEGEQIDLQEVAELFGGDFAIIDDVNYALEVINE